MLFAYDFRKGMNPSVSHPSNRLIVGEIGFFSVSSAISVREGKLRIQTSCTPLKSKLVSHNVPGGRVGYMHNDWLATISRGDIRSMNLVCRDVTLNEG